MSLQRAPEAMSAAEWATRVKLAAAYRIAALEGADDGVFNHFSCAVPDEPGHFLLKPFGPLFSEATASGLLKVDLSGAIVSGSGKWEPTAFLIHSRIHQHVPRARCILHSHMPYATALASLADMRIQPVNQSSMRFVKRTAYLESYRGLVLDEAEALSIVEALAEHDVLLMANHGVTVIDDTVEGCVYDLHYLEWACRDQLLVSSFGQPVRAIPEAVVEAAAAQMVEEKAYAKAAHFAAMLRRLDRENPGYDS
ncbi:Ribulose-5-phosphate 4-epimerase/Fuculose-1-phosphate aldolase [Tistlia consotensis]|uniref:Ribulose-5-phosphate 4-epimerase/Fuculose-1-phosphate aldolase n=1 Tax=Tistlia consotensis USBA 355 TaxID=560819 RepID=A0A1Y6C0L5_9PROT|nr:class II aldolase/adducin family protein [Tistlia consotensis]SMF37255.1 Ribulose-5-phosphate 4-epimerase/Fuculose-1-phosphate aldolase [Tistlia consotensis USBA 355]SNR72616.1 Ribulose-5-phosphate 4-epimerase/Fuculose-1-phosphate aldolase [Tistlia consotensis]